MPTVTLTQRLALRSKDFGFYLGSKPYHRSNRFCTSSYTAETQPERMLARLIIQWRKRRRRGQVAVNLRIESFTGNSERQSFVRCTVEAETIPFHMWPRLNCVALAIRGYNKGKKIKYRVLCTCSNWRHTISTEEYCPHCTRVPWPFECGSRDNAHPHRTPDTFVNEGAYQNMELSKLGNKWKSKLTGTII
ncbi:hypothetical protein EVAR_3852_1 [Eumeta japonica]|uniref:Uncharacterized protein n=1 Tax=Eumeta variegata TaxID=151549 RepID=A0A4C1SR53_EUMVA|nr:hypothetical protein EVAR_3852_1 [Eumeta japonica]